MLREDLMTYAAPTLAGIKTGNLFSVRRSGENVEAEIRELNRTLTGRGLRLIPVRTRGQKTWVYLYRPDLLRRDLSRPEARTILMQKGYPYENADWCLVELVKHLAEDEHFPHEIGLFLGYPPADVRGFMEHPCEGVKCCGCWKAYGDEGAAKQTFARYEKCNRIYRQALEKGRPLEAYIVDTRQSLGLAI